MKSLLAPLALILGAAATPTVYEPVEAIRLAQANPYGKSGRFEMIVAATGVTPHGVFLNSTADYRAADNLTFRLTPIVAHELGKRFGAPAVDYLKGKLVVVDGRIAEKPIANTFSGRPRDLNRFQHEVDVEHVTQLISAD